MSRFLCHLLVLAALVVPRVDAQVPSPRAEHTAVWTGTEMIVWGGKNGSGVLGTGGRFNPATGAWMSTSATNAPSARTRHSAVWTGSEMIVFGGFVSSSGTYLATGARYNPSNDTWTALPAASAPAARARHSAVWTGSHMIVFGGSFLAAGEFDPVYFNSGAAYSLAGNSWTATALSGAPYGRLGHTAIWSGSQMIAWAGQVDDLTANPYRANDGGRLSWPANTWAATTTNSAPTNRTEHTAVWTGSRMIAWGGLGNESLDFLSDGGRYDPVANSWQATALAGAPTNRHLHTAVWTGTEMIVWGGRAGGSFRGNGGRYTPANDSWTVMSDSGAPDARASHTAVWTGSEMIVWGGEGYVGAYYDSMGRYFPAQNVWGVPPSSAITNPPGNSLVLANGTINVAALAADTDGSVAQVEFLVNGASIGVDAAAPYSRAWTNGGQGFFTLTAVATDNSGLVSTSAPVVVESLAAPVLFVTRTNTNYFVTLSNGQNGRSYRIDASANLSTWVPLATNIATNGGFTVPDPSATPLSNRYYRAVP